MEILHHTGTSTVFWPFSVFQLKKFDHYTEQKQLGAQKGTTNVCQIAKLISTKSGDVAVVHFCIPLIKFLNLAKQL